MTGRKNRHPPRRYGRFRTLLKVFGFCPLKKRLTLSRPRRSFQDGDVSWQMGTIPAGRSQFSRISRRARRLPLVRPGRHRPSKIGETPAILRRWGPGAKELFPVTPNSFCAERYGARGFARVQARYGTPGMLQYQRERCPSSAVRLLAPVLVPVLVPGGGKDAAPENAPCHGGFGTRICTDGPDGEKTGEMVPAAFRIPTVRRIPGDPQVAAEAQAGTARMEHGALALRV